MILLKNIKRGNKKRWSIRQQTLFFKTLGDLISSGFSLRQSLSDIMIFFPKQMWVCKRIESEIEQGNLFCTGLNQLIHKDMYNQLLIAEKFGFLPKMLNQLGELCEKKEDQKRKLLAVLVYPLILLIMLVFFGIAIKFFWQPEMDSLTPENSSKSGYNMVIIFVLVISLIGFLYELWSFKKSSILQQRQKLCRLPIVGNLIKEYYAYYITFNLAALLKEGMNIKEIYNFLKEFEGRTFLYEIGVELGEYLNNGTSVHEFIKKYDFFPSEISLFLQKGKILNLVGEELFLFSELTHKKLTIQINRLIEMVQPILFIIIAILIVIAYLKMLAPIYDNLGGI